MTSPRKPPARPREPRTRREVVADIDKALTVLTRGQQHHTDPRATQRINQLLDVRNELSQEDQ